MELKANKLVDALGGPNRVNPFNGIERHRDAEHHRNDNTQGIHSMELKGI